MTNESEDEHGEFGGELLPACDSSVKEKKIYWSTQFAKTFVSKLCKYKIIKQKNYLYLWHSCKKKNTASSCYQLLNRGTCAFV